MNNQLVKIENVIDYNFPTNLFTIDKIDGQIADGQIADVNSLQLFLTYKGTERDCKELDYLTDKFSSSIKVKEEPYTKTLKAIGVYNGNIIDITITNIPKSYKIKHEEYIDPELDALELFK